MRVISEMSCECDRQAHAQRSRLVEQRGKHQQADEQQDESGSDIRVLGIIRELGKTWHCEIRWWSTETLRALSIDYLACNVSDQNPIDQCVPIWLPVLKIFCLQFMQAGATEYRQSPGSVEECSAWAGRLWRTAEDRRTVARPCLLPKVPAARTFRPIHGKSINEFRPRKWFA